MTSDNIPLGVDKAGAPRFCCSNVAVTFKIGPELRRGIADDNGTGETVGGIVVMRYGENALQGHQKCQKTNGSAQIGASRRGSI